MADGVHPRKGMPSPQLTEEQFRARYLSQFQDPAFDAVRNEIERITAVAWDSYSQYRKSVHVQKAGPGYAQPDYELSTDWIAAADAVRAESFARFEATLEQEGVADVVPTYQLWRVDQLREGCTKAGFLAPPEENWANIVATLRVTLPTHMDTGRGPAECHSASAAQSRT